MEGTHLEDVPGSRKREPNPLRVRTKWHEGKGNKSAHAVSGEIKGEKVSAIARGEHKPVIFESGAPTSVNDRYALETQIRKTVSGSENPIVLENDANASLPTRLSKLFRRLLARSVPEDPSDPPKKHTTH